MAVMAFTWIHNGLQSWRALIRLVFCNVFLICNVFIKLRAVYQRVKSKKINKRTWIKLSNVLKITSHLVEKQTWAGYLYVKTSVVTNQCFRRSDIVSWCRRMTNQPGRWRNIQKIMVVWPISHSNLTNCNFFTTRQYVHLQANCTKQCFSSSTKHLAKTDRNNLSHSPPHLQLKIQVTLKWLVFTVPELAAKHFPQTSCKLCWASFVDIGVGRGQGRAFAPEILNLTFSFYVFSKICCCFSFERVKWNFIIFSPPWKNPWPPLEKSTIAPHRKKSFRRPSPFRVLPAQELL